MLFTQSFSSVLKQIFLFTVLLTNQLEFGYSQNLVSNPAFNTSKVTSTIHYPNELMQQPTVPENWEIISGFPDFFNDLKSTYLGFPILNTMEGTGGKLGMRMTNKNNEHEAVQTRLSQELIKGEKYIISFTMAQLQYSNYSMNMIPFILSKERITKDNIIDQTQNNLCILETNENYLYSDGWKTVHFVYEAKGGEKYLTLVNNSYTFSQQVKSNSNRARFNFTGNHLDRSSYYFFSEIKVELTTEENLCEPFIYSENENITKNESFDSFQQKLQTLIKLNLVEINESKLQKSNLLPEHLIFMIDISGSMKSGFRNLKRFVLEILENTPDDRLVSLIVFNQRSRIVLQRVHKQGVKDVLNVFFAKGETNVTAGLNDLNRLINPSEQTTLEIFTDEKSSVKTFMNIVHTNEFSLLKTSDFHLKYESKLAPVISKNAALVSRVLTRHIYDDENPNDYFNFKPGKLKGFQHAKECSILMQSNDVEEVDFTDEKITNNVFLIDVSSSMKERNKLSELKKSLFTYTGSLDASNRVSVVSFSSTIKVLLDAVFIDDPFFREVIQDLKGSGTTKVNDGIKYIYDHYKNKKNQNLSFVLFTDGVFKLSKESEDLILENQNIHLTIFQFGDRKNKQLVELSKQLKLNYKKIKPKKITEALIELNKENPFPGIYSTGQPEVWRFFQNNIMEITGYNE